MISAARQALWKNDEASPVSFTVGRKYVKCSDSVMTVPSTVVVHGSSPTTLTTTMPEFDVAEWVNRGLPEISEMCRKRNMHVMPYTANGNTLTLSGPWNVFDERLMASAKTLCSGETVRVRVAPVMQMLAPNEFRVGLRAVDVCRVTNVE